MTTLEANNEILGILMDYVNSNPTVRFNQALFNLNIIEFSDEAKEKMKSPIPNDGVYTLKDDYAKSSQEILKDIKL
jgi:hypothetical protein